MSLYVFNIKPDHAVVTADTRQCEEIDGVFYRVNDRTQKLFVLDDMIITTGGSAWLCRYLIGQWRKRKPYTPDRLLKITQNTILHVNELAEKIGAPKKDYTADPYLMEICILRYDRRLGHNVFYSISTSNGYQLFRWDVDGLQNREAYIYGGIDTEIVQSYFQTHRNELREDYLNTVHRAYELAASEEVGGYLTAAIQDKAQIRCIEKKINDYRPVQSRMSPTAGPADGYNIVGKHLIIEAPNPEGGVTNFRADSSGVFLNNGKMYFQSDKGGKVGIDAHYGLFGGTKDLFEYDGTGYVRPSFINEKGEIALDKDGMPKNTNFLLGIDGDAYFRGRVHMESGSARGNFYADNFYFNDGDSVRTLLDKATKKFDLSDLDYIDLGGITLDGKTGNINFTGAGSITWGKNAPTKKQFSVGIGGPWHDEMQDTDKWRRDWDYFSDMWDVPYQFRGEDGRPGSDGSDATVNYANIKAALQKADSLPTAFMSVDEMGAPKIFGGEIYGAKIYAGYSDGFGTGSLISLTNDGIQMSNESNGTNLQIKSYNMDRIGPVTLIEGGSNGLLMSGQYLYFGTGEVGTFRGMEINPSGCVFSGKVNFANAEVTGLTAVFA